MDEQKQNDNRIEAIKELGMNSLTKSEESDIHMINIIGQVEGHTELPPQNKTTKYEHIIPQLIAIEQSKSIRGFLIILNTAGGDVEAGLAIAEMISSMTKPSVSLVLGGGHSIGVPLAVSADYSFIVQTASMTIHPVKMNGMVVTLPQTLEYFNKVQDRILHFICKHSHIELKRLRALMINAGDIANEAGTLLIGKEAVKAGIIDKVGGLSDAISKLRQLIGENDKRADVSKEKKSVSEGKR
ncbi:MAG: ATP-dependent Clp protease proteolytic subunit [Eubacteriales bacterium]